MEGGRGRRTDERMVGGVDEWIPWKEDERINEIILMLCICQKPFHCHHPFNPTPTLEREKARTVSTGWVGVRPRSREGTPLPPSTGGLPGAGASPKLQAASVPWSGEARP